MEPLRLLAALVTLSAIAGAAEPSLPHLRKQGTATQLILRLEPGRFTLQRIELYRYR